MNAGSAAHANRVRHGNDPRQDSAPEPTIEVLGAEQPPALTARAAVHGIEDEPALVAATELGG